MSTYFDNLYGGGNIPTFNNTGTLAPPNFINGGAQNNTALSTLINNFSPAFIGPNWTALLAAISTGDAYVAQVNQGALDQSFLASADFPYLIDRASDLGITYPQNVGMNENRIQKFCVKCKC